MSTALFCARRFLDAAIVFCDAAREAGARGTCVFLHRTDGLPGLVIDNFNIEDGHRLFATSDTDWLHNPAFGDHKLFGPLIGRDGEFGTAIFGFLGEPTIELERRLMLLTTQLSVWCTDHGVGRLPDEPARALAPRQHQIARLAAAGRTNGEIADALGISINTVKLRLKHVFERLGVSNRTELSNTLRCLAPLEGIAEGVTHLERVTVTRAARVTVAGSANGSSRRSSGPRAGRARRRLPST